MAGRQHGKAGAVLRQYVTDGAWWGLEAAGAASGGADGYMEVLGTLGEDFALGSPRLRGGWHVAAGLGGGGDVDTGNGWLVKAGPTLRWKSPWGPSLHLDAGVMGAATGKFKSTFARFSLALPLDEAIGREGPFAEREGLVQTQAVYASLQHLPQVRFKNGREESVGHLAMVLTRDLGRHVYGTAQAGSAAFGSAGAYSFGLFGLGVQTQPWASLPGQPRVGVEALVVRPAAAAWRWPVVRWRRLRPGRSGRWAASNAGACAPAWASGAACAARRKRPRW